MKKELIAAVLLAVIFAGVMLNIRASEKIVSSLMSEVDAAYAQLKSGDNESAVFYPVELAADKAENPGENGRKDDGNKRKADPVNCGRRYRRRAVEQRLSRGI